MSEKSIEENILELEDGWAYIRNNAARALGRIGDASAVPALIKALGDRCEEVRVGAAWALGEIGDASAVPALIKALGDEDRDVGGAAAYALGKIGDRSAVPALIDALEDKYFKSVAVRALGKIGDASAVPALIDAFGDEDRDVRLRAIEALVEIGAPAVPALIGVLGDEDWDVRREAAEAVGEIGPRSSADLELIRSVAREAKKEGKPVDGFAKVYSAWSKKLNERADALVKDKTFHVPKVGKPDRIERVLRVWRVGA